MQLKGRISGLFCMILTVAYSIYIDSYFYNAVSSDLGGAIATALVTPHMAMVAIAAIMAIIGYFMKARWAFLVAGILLVVASVIFLPYAMFVLVQIILSFVTYVRMGDMCMQKDLNGKY